MPKPYVIIHTHTSVDGKINRIESPKFPAVSRQYQAVSITPETSILKIDGYLNGRISTDDNITDFRTPAVDEHAPPVPQGDFIACRDAPMYYVSLDPSGRLDWQFSELHYAGVRTHIIEVLSSRASNAYKDFLRRRGISYIICGGEALDNALVLEKLNTIWGMQRVMIGGGGTINWAFLQAGLVDEVRIMMGPFANGDPNMPGLFKAAAPLSEIAPITFSVKEIKVLDDDVVWLRYTVDKPAGTSAA